MKVILKQQMIRTNIRIIRIVKIVADISATFFYIHRQADIIGP